MTYYSDHMRHLVCVPYTVENLHAMAAELGIKRCWFHSGKYKHYDIPLYRFAEVAKRTNVVSPRRVLEIVKTGK